jgi:hypothetical protein
MNVIVVLATEGSHTWLAGTYTTRKGAADPILNAPDHTVVYTDDSKAPWTIGVRIEGRPRLYNLWRETVKE